MTINDVTCTVLVGPNCNSNACDSAQDTIVVEAHTDDGATGIGETDANSWVIKALIEAHGSHIMNLGLKELVVGQDHRAGSPLGQTVQVERDHGQTERRNLRDWRSGHCSLGPIWKSHGATDLAIVRRRTTGVCHAVRQPAPGTLEDYRRSLLE